MFNITNNSAPNLVNSKLVGVFFLTMLTGWSGSSIAQWSVVDNALNAKATTINANLTDLNAKLKYLGPNPVAVAPGIVDNATALNTSALAGGGTYGASASATMFGVGSTPCSNGASGATKFPTATGISGFNACELGRQVMAAAYENSFKYYKQFAEYNLKIRGLIATPISNLNHIQIAALQFHPFCSLTGVVEELMLA